MRKDTTEDMRLYIAIGIGGMIGAISRYGLSLMLTNTLPYATLIANLAGCFLLTYIIHNDSIRKRFTPEIIMALTVGIIGSFTTFSTFMIQTIELSQMNILFSISYILTSIVGGLFMCFLGYKLAQRRTNRI